MSASLVAVLRCDHPECGATFKYSNAPTTWRAWKPPRLSDARREMRMNGWKHGVRLRVDAGPAPSFDFCPEHADDVRDYHEVTL